jgi:hypothetical protein
MAEVPANAAVPSAPSPRPAVKRSTAPKVVVSDSPESLPTVPTSHLVYQLLKSGQLLGFLVVALVFALCCVLATRTDATYALISGTAKEILLPIVTLYLGFIFGQYAGKRRK